MALPIRVFDPVNGVTYALTKTIIDGILGSGSEGGDAVNTDITTAVGGTLTATGLVGGIITRSGPTAAYSDATATAAALLTALGNTASNPTPVGSSWFVTIKNTVPFAQTITAGAGVTLSPTTMVLSPNSSSTFLLTYSAATPAFTMTFVTTTQNVVLPATKLTVGTAATAAAGDLSGANFVNYENNASNANFTTRTAAQMVADIPVAAIGFEYMLAIRNLNATGLTIAAADGTITLSGTMTVAQNATRLLHVKIVSATAITMTSVGLMAGA